MYLLETRHKFEAVVDHKPLLPLFNRGTRTKQARVESQRMKLAAESWISRWDLQCYLYRNRFCLLYSLFTSCVDGS